MRPAPRRPRPPSPTSVSSGRVLVVLEPHDELAWKSFRNLPEVHLLAADQLNTYDVLVSDYVVFTTDVAAVERRREERPEVKDPHDIMLRPVVSEKTYTQVEALQCLHLRGRQVGVEARDRRRARSHLRRRQGEEREHHEPQGQARPESPERSLVEAVRRQESRDHPFRG